MVLKEIKFITYIIVLEILFMCTLKTLLKTKANKQEGDFLKHQDTKTIHKR